MKILRGILRIFEPIIKAILSIGRIVVFPFVIAWPYVKGPLKWVFEFLVNAAPFIMIFTTLLSGIFSHYGFYHDVYLYLPDSIGYSVLACIVMAKLYFRRKYCLPTKVATSGLIVMNLLNIWFIHRTGESGYDFVFDVYIVILCALVVISYYLFIWLI